MSTLAEIANSAGVAIGKATAPAVTSTDIKRSKRRQKRLSEMSGVLGLAALGTRAPQAAKWAASKSPRIAGSRPLKAIARFEPRATKASEAIVPASLGIGAMGSLNFASQQGKEAKLPKTPKSASLDGVDHLQGGVAKRLSSAERERSKRNANLRNAAIAGGGGVAGAGAMLGVQHQAKRQAARSFWPSDDPEPSPWFTEKGRLNRAADHPFSRDTRQWVKENLGPDSKINWARDTKARNAVRFKSFQRASRRYHGAQVPGSAALAALAAAPVFLGAAGVREARRRKVAKAYVNGRWMPITQVPKGELRRAAKRGAIGEKHLRRVDAVQNDVRNNAMADLKETINSVPTSGEMRHPRTGRRLLVQRNTAATNAAGPHVWFGLKPGDPHKIRLADPDSMKAINNAKGRLRWQGSRLHGFDTEGINAHEMVHAGRRRSSGSRESATLQRAMDANRKHVLRAAIADKPAAETFHRVRLNLGVGRDMTRLRLGEEARADVLASRRLGRRVGGGHVHDTGSAKDYIRARQNIENRMGMTPSKRRDIVYPVSPQTAAQGTLVGAAGFYGAKEYEQRKKVKKGLPRYLTDMPRPTATTRIAQKYSAVPFGNPRQFARRDFPWVPAEGLEGVKRKNVEAAYMASRLNAHHIGRDRAERLATGELKPGGSKRSMARERSRQRLIELEGMGKSLFATPPYSVLVKRDDTFLREHGDRISIGAENAYNDLGRRKRRRYSDAAAHGTIAAGTGLTGAGLLHATVRNPMKASAKTRIGLATLGTGALATSGLVGRSAYRRSQEGLSLQERRAKIKAKAYERHAQGIWGRPAHARKRTTSLSEASKALAPIGAPRVGGLMRRNGKVFTRRGTIPGTGAFTPRRIF